MWGKRLMYADQVIKLLCVPPRTAAFIVRAFADSDGYNHSEEPEQAIEYWAERFLKLPAEEQIRWMRVGLKRQNDLFYNQQRPFKT